MKFEIGPFDIGLVFIEATIGMFSLLVHLGKAKTLFEALKINSS